MKNRGFTLIEIIVAMAILSIMAGTLVPMLYKTWESNEIAVTRGRMLELKKAMVGDRALVQQGIRTHYGFVGDNGDLPNSISDLLTDSGAWANWNGPYLGGFDPTTYDLDAWGNAIVYSQHDPFLTVSGMRVAATLRSAGPDRTFGTGDDINENSDLALQILGDDAWPTDRVQGNRTFTFSVGPTLPATDYHARLQVNSNTVAGAEMAWEKTSCEALGFDSATGFPQTVTKTFNFELTNPLPVGRIVLSSQLFEDADCTLPALEEASVSIFVSDGQKTIFVNPPPLYH